MTNRMVVRDRNTSEVTAPSLAVLSLSNAHKKQFCARSKSIPDFTKRKELASKWSRCIDSPSCNNERRTTSDHSKMNSSKSTLRSHSWLALRRLRWRLRKYFPKAAFYDGRDPPDADCILQSHIEQIPHLRGSYNESIRNVREPTEQKDGYGFVLLTEDDCTENGGNKSSHQFRIMIEVIDEFLLQM
ncbi:hypothetical protein TSMEX_008394 [Taenia solium]|eukprot:TsM_000933600 transcript=TsM_000933600 gene=TsM_000933600